MAFEFLLLALIDDGQPVQLNTYENDTAFQCILDAEKLNEYVANSYVHVRR